MRYFQMKQDIALRYVIELRDFDLLHEHRTFELDEYDQLNDNTVLYLNGTGDEICPDFIEHPVYLLSESLKTIVQLYEDDLITRKVALVHKDAARQIPMALLLLKRIDALHDECEYYPDHRVKTLILDQEKIGSHQMFLLPKGCQETIIVSLNVVESLLRRNIIGVQFEEVEVR